MYSNLKHHVSGLKFHNGKLTGLSYRICRFCHSSSFCYEDCMTILHSHVQLFVGNIPCLKSVFFMCLANMNKLISIEIDMQLCMTRNKHLTKTVHKVPTSPGICASTTFENLIWQIEPSMLYTVDYMSILINHWIIQLWLTVFVSNIAKRVISHIIFMLCARNVHLQCIPRFRMSTNGDDASRMSGQIWITRCLLNVRQRIPLSYRL